MSNREINAKCGPLYKVQWKTASSQGEGFATLTKNAGWKFHYPVDLAQTNGKMVGGRKVHALREATWEDVLFFHDQFTIGSI